MTFHAPKPLTSANCEGKSQEIKDLYANETGWISIVPEEYRDASLDCCGCLPDIFHPFGVKWARSWPLKSLFLWGKYGAGKTTYAFALIKKLMQTRHASEYFWPRYVTGRQLDAQLLRASRQEGEEWEIQKFSDQDLLFLDDLGRVTPTERFKIQLFEIINQRMACRKPTIITSNCSPEELGSVIDGAVLSRMRDTSKWAIVKFPDHDLRQEHNRRQ